MAIRLEAGYSPYAYAARLTGYSQRYGFNWEDLPPVRSGKTGRKYYLVDEPGVYEVMRVGRKSPWRQYYLVELVGGELRAKIISLERAKEIVNNGGVP